jgi:hypothetical protein
LQADVITAADREGETVGFFETVEASASAQIMLEHAAVTAAAAAEATG